jgi:hypothetical protein
MRETLQSIFSEHFARYAHTHTLHLRELRAASAIMNCYTAALGGRVLSCPAGHYSVTSYNACRHRSCPKCADRPRQQWVHTELQRLLPCEHYHAVFTLPHDFIALWAFNRQRMNTLLFDCARHSLLELCADERHLGAKPGVLMALHTWGRTLSQHPHVHCLVSGGGVNAQGQWRRCRQDYLVPVKALAALFRGKLLHHIKHDIDAQRLRLPPHQDAQHWRACIKAQYRKHWNVELAPPYAHGRGVALYLARYVKGGPLPSDRHLDHDGQCVSLGYTDHRDQRAKTLRLDAQEFIARVLWHAPPARQHMVRHCGLYATAARQQHRQCAKLLSPTVMPTAPATLACHALTHTAQCPRCELPLRTTQSLLPAHRSGEISMEEPPRASAPLGSTQRWSGQAPASQPLALRRRSLRRRSPLN